MFNFSIGYFVLFLIVGCHSVARVELESETWIVKERVVDVRSEPVAHNKKYEYDPKQETQVEQGELVLVLEKREGWARIEALEQTEYSHHDKWEGYPGWVKLSALTHDLSVQRKPQDLNLGNKAFRERLLQEAEKHLGSPYLWGGRSLYDPTYTKNITGVDCSGLVNWAYRQMGWLIPRDAHEQYLKSEKREPKELKPADLIFLAKPDRPEKVVHVALYAGGDELIEAPQSGEKVRRIGFKDRFGKSLSELTYGEQIGDRILYFGSIYPLEKKTE